MRKHMHDEQLVKSFLLCFLGYATAMYGNSLLVVNDLCAIWIHAIGLLYSFLGFCIQCNDND